MSKMGWDVKVDRICSRAVLFLALVVWSAQVTGAEEAAQAAATPAPGEAQREGEVRREGEGRPSLQLGADFGLASPTPGITGYRPIGEVESRGLRVAPFTIRAAVITGIGYDDNVTLSETNKVSSMLFTVSPSVSVGLEGATHRYHAVYRGNYGRYVSSSGDNYEDHNFSLVAVDQWGTRLRTVLNYDFLRGHNQRGSTVAATAVQDRWDYHSARATGSYGAEGAVGRLEGSAAYSARRYRNTPPGVVEIRDYDQFDLRGGFSVRLAPKTRGLLEIQRSDVTHEADPTLDSVEMRYFTGVTWEALAKTRGTIKLGYTTKDFSDGSRLDYSAPTFEAGVTWLPRTYSVVNLNFGKVLSETPDTASYFSVVTVSSLSWNHQWSERMRTILSYTLTRQHLQGLGRSDKYQSVVASTSYALRRWLRVGAEFRHDVRDANVPGLDFSRNLSILTLESAL